MHIFNKTIIAEAAHPDTTVPLVIDAEGTNMDALYILGVSGTHVPTVQALSAVDSSVWLNAFGQRPAPVQINGVAVPHLYNGGQECEARTDFDIRKSLLQVYLKYKLGAASTPLKMSFHNIVMTGYFKEFQFSNYNGNIPKAMAFTMSFLCIIETLLNEDERAMVNF